MGRKVRIDMAGLRYGRLVAIECAHRDASGHVHWRFRCDCGEETVAHGGNVRAGRTTSCGCYHRETSAARLTVHGARGGRRHGPTYRAWQQMNDACARVAVGAPDIGGSAMPVATDWCGDYAAFVRDLGERPAGTGLARIDEAEGFAPHNCRWMPIEDRSERAAAGWRKRRAAPRSRPRKISR